jgi:hypothetical protein
MRSVVINIAPATGRIDQPVIQPRHDTPTTLLGRFANRPKTPPYAANNKRTPTKINMTANIDLRGLAGM